MRLDIASIAQSYQNGNGTWQDPYGLAEIRTWDDAPSQFRLMETVSEQAHLEEVARLFYWLGDAHCLYLDEASLTDGIDAYPVCIGMEVFVQPGSHL